MGPLDTAVQDMLQSKIDVGGRSITIIKATKPGNVPLSARGQPSTALVQAIEAAVKDKLTVSQKQQMFRFIGWKFQCRTCFLPRDAADFDGKGFTFWGDVDPPQVQLRSGPCNVCQYVNRSRDNPVGGVAYKIVPPESGTSLGP